MPSFCPSCKNVLTSSEFGGGACPVCNHVFAAPPAPQLVVVQEPPAPARSLPPNVRKAIAALLFVAGLASFFLPFGMYWSIDLGFRKGGSRCAYAGCEKVTEKKIGYQNERALPPPFADAEQKPDEEVGYCAEHFSKAPTKVTVQRGKSFSGLIAVFFLLGGPFLFALFYLGCFLGAWFGEPGFLLRHGLMTLAVVPINAVSLFYWRWLHWGFTHSGW